MSRKHDVSDELLNSFIDDELDSDERERLLEAAREDRGLASDMCELRHIKELTQHAYRDKRPPRRGGSGGTSRGSAWIKGLAAGLLVAVGAVAGWLGAGGALTGSQPPEATASFMSVEEAHQLAATPQAAQMRHIVLHLSTDEPQKVQAALDTAEALIRTHHRHNVPVELELVANADGLSLLRADVSPYAGRIRQMVADYDSLTFLACNKAIQRLQREGIPVKLLPEARVAGSALDQILKRLREGWVYIKA